MFCAMGNFYLFAYLFAANISELWFIDFIIILAKLIIDPVLCIFESKVQQKFSSQSSLNYRFSKNPPLISQLNTFLTSN